MARKRNELVAEARRAERERSYKALRFLSRIKALRVRLDTLLTEADAQRELADGLKAVRIKDGGPSGVYRDALPDAIARLEEISNECNREARKYAEAYAEAHAVIKALPDHAEASVITRYFLLGQSTARIASDCAYSTTDVITLERTGLQSVYDVMPLEWREAPLDEDNLFSGYFDYVVEAKMASCRS